MGVKSWYEEICAVIGDVSRDKVPTGELITVRDMDGVGKIHEKVAGFGKVEGGAVEVRK